MVSLLVAQVNLTFQVVIFMLLAAGMLFKRKNKVKTHGQLMLTAVILNVVSFLSVMGPSWSKTWTGASSMLGIVVLGHASSGGLALLLSFWLLGSWLSSPLLAQPLKTRCDTALNKKIMWAVLFLWLESLILGVVLYAMLHMGVSV